MRYIKSGGGGGGCGIGIAGHSPWSSWIFFSMRFKVDLMRFLSPRASERIAIANSAAAFLIGWPVSVSSDAQLNAPCSPLCSSLPVAGESAWSPVAVSVAGAAWAGMWSCGTRAPTVAVSPRARRIRSAMAVNMSIVFLPFVSVRVGCVGSVGNSAKSL